MGNAFPSILSSLRKEKGLNQRKAAADLHISQALLSHYENGLREPGLDFVVSACDYYTVSADYLLGRSELRAGGFMSPSKDADEHAGVCMRSYSQMFAFLESLESDELRSGAMRILAAAVYRLFRLFGGDEGCSFDRELALPLVEAGLIMNELKLTELARSCGAQAETPYELAELAESEISRFAGMIEKEN